MSDPSKPTSVSAPFNPEAERDSLKDFPLRPEPPLDPGPPPTGALPAPFASGFATLADRALAVAADVATSVLVVLVALLAAFAVRGRTPQIAGLGWAALFFLLVSFFAVVVPFVLFGRTVGMALAGLVARDDGAGRRLTASQAARRWAGTLATLVGVGLPLLWTARDSGGPTPADRFSGRTLVRGG